ncbi:unnamed protein product [Pipistrellus nathusii]|uniref:Uncharacterized protein n=1 Tax=Pipistrellus nathusii TaxID=59473 RepID=A0ABN9ZU92_PIPNA
MRAVVLFVFLAVPKTCPLSIIWRTQAVSGLAPLKTDIPWLGSGNREGQRNLQKAGASALILTGFLGRDCNGASFPWTIYAKQYLVQVSTHQLGESVTICIDRGLLNAFT